MNQKCQISPFSVFWAFEITSSHCWRISSTSFSPSSVDLYSHWGVGGDFFLLLWVHVEKSGISLPPLTLLLLFVSSHFNFSAPSFFTPTFSAPLSSSSSYIYSGFCCLSSSSFNSFHYLLPPPPLILFLLFLFLCLSIFLYFLCCAPYPQPPHTLLLLWSE